MAILKHLSSKSADYKRAMEYLMYEQDRIKNCPLKDEDGYLVMRENYRIDAIDCCVSTFDTECRQLNRKFKKNQKYSDIKSHHYIISFDPKDSIEGKLTMDEAQSLGMEFAKKNFPGHQALVCTHGDGENKSGNIHVHIIINSLRKRDVELMPFMERKIDSLAGYKHHLTDNYLNHLKREVMHLCQKKRLNQVDLLSPAKKKVTEKEYWSDFRGKRTHGSEFETRKETLRNAIENCAKDAKSEKDFSRLLKERHDVILKISRGRYGYLLPGREKPIRGRMLGTNYTEEYLRPVFAENAKDIHRGNATDNRKIQSPQKSQRDELMEQVAKLEKMAKIKVPYEITMPTKLPLVRDLQASALSDASRAYDRRAKIINLKEMAETLLYLENHGLASRADLDKSYDSLRADTADKMESFKIADEGIISLNEQIHYTGQYLANKGTYKAFVKSKDKGWFRSKHETELILYEEARNYFKEHFENDTLPSTAYFKSTPGKIVPIERLKKERSKLMEKRKNLRKEYHQARNAEKELYAIKRNVDTILREPTLSMTRRRSHASELE